MNQLFSLEEQLPIDLNDLRIFCRVAELASFTKAAEQLNMAKGRVSTVVQSLETEVGSRLLQRTTRSVRLTPDGEIFLDRCKELLLESDQLQGMFRPMTGDLCGSVRIDMPGLFAQELVLPKLPELLSAHPQLDLGISINDRWVDMVREGVDCLIRIGALPDSELVVRTIGTMKMCNLASPAYLKKYGVPLSLDDLPEEIPRRIRLRLPVLIGEKPSATLIEPEFSTLSFTQHPAKRDLRRPLAPPAPTDVCVTP